MEEAERLASEARKAEEERLQKAIEEAKKRENEEKKKKEEEESRRKELGKKKKKKFFWPYPDSNPGPQAWQSPNTMQKSKNSTFYQIWRA